MNQALTPVKLQGPLGGRFGPVHYLDVKSPGEAVHAMCMTIPGFEDYFGAPGRRYKILVKNQPVQGIEHMADPSGRQEIRIVPIVRGAKDAGLEIIEGVALIGLAVALGPAGWGVIAANSWQMTALMGMGMSMTIGGVAQLFMSPPAGPENGAKSYLFSNASNPVAQGIPVPVLYGQIVITPPLISMGIDTEAFSTTLFSPDVDASWTTTGDKPPYMHYNNGNLDTLPSVWAIDAI